jgi:hypothetical protein
MTLFGKLLVFLNLIGGIGMAVYSTSIYTNRPGLFTDIKDGGIDKGNLPINFPKLTADIDSQGKAALLASSAWSTELKSLEAAESLRYSRYQKMFGTRPDGTKAAAKGLIDYAHEGGLPDAKGGGFLNLVEDPATRLYNLSPAPTDFKKVVVHGPDDSPLKGTDTLLDQYTKDGAEAEVQAFMSKKLRMQLRMLGSEIVKVQDQVHKQREIRDNLVNEAVFLANFEINVTLNRETYLARQKQLRERLKPFDEMKKP